MNRLSLATAAIVAFGAAGTASAADLGTRTYTKASAPVEAGYNWSGFYAGVMGGYGWSDRVRLDGVTARSNDIKGGFGGGTIGYNWQTPGSAWVWGLEVDAAASGIKYSEALAPDLNFEDKLRAFGSVTGRVGVTAGAALFYAKGGYAWANNRVSFTVPGIVTASESKNLSGWTVGGGVEYMVAPSWSLKGEYMYADYGNGRYGDATSGYTSLGLTTHTVKGGLNYHFNNPVVARY
ncbi:outer membrane beta-barrel protein [Tardiphaga sp.]|uniref:outer membrane protein n=1 Tax=Tardiphaga sp. TaxID=1926292 RepID=UPI0025CFB9BC|nr:outer membrane beta-barrel protein [Tardiphaga sp.]